MKRFSMIIVAVLTFAAACEIMPRNTLPDCRMQCPDSKKSQACYDFCDCIHKEGLPLDTCLDRYDKAPQDSIRTQK